ncbi:Shs13 protein [Suillus clintonianus]|uniref:Shs13 protein n=1 Tax=Suillus clintonianus TaxID=1904413 RepID=UPI001B88133A|nr:Shs13 protein [Suillus clintonianus]KAG2154529.1 Shs13 protein [Suillus clintonianus]
MHFYSAILALTALTAGVRALPPRRITPRNAIGNVMTGAGGSAPAGSVIGTGATTNCTGPLSLFGCHGLDIINIGSNNAGSGGVASSGSAAVQRVGSKKFGSSKFKGVPIGNVTTGTGGSAPGGSVNGVPGGLINIGSNNAGNGGTGTSGDVV